MKKSAATPALWQRRHTDRALFFSHTKSVRLENRAVLGGRTSTSVHFFFRPGTIWFNECSTENERALYYSLWLNLSAPYNTQFILLYHLLH